MIVFSRCAIVTILLGVLFSARSLASDLPVPKRQVGEQQAVSSSAPQPARLTPPKLARTIKLTEFADELTAVTGEKYVSRNFSAKNAPVQIVYSRQLVVFGRLESVESVFEYTTKSKKLLGSGAKHGVTTYPDIAQPVLTPDGKSLVGTKFIDGRPSLVVHDLSASKTTLIGMPGVGRADAMPDTHPSKGPVVFHSLVGTQSHICSVNPDGSDYRVRIPGTNPEWLPDGRHIVFTTPVDTAARIPNHLALLDNASGRITSLTSGPVAMYDASPSPDGEWVVCMSQAELQRTPAILLVHLQTRGVILLMEPTIVQVAYPEWGQDGRIYFSSTYGATTPQPANPNEWSQSRIWSLKPDLKKAIIFLDELLEGTSDKKKK